MMGREDPLLELELTSSSLRGSVCRYPGDHGEVNRALIRASPGFSSPGGGLTVKGNYATSSPPYHVAMY